MKAVYSKPDFWALKAQKEDYPARSVYKLQELAEKFSLFRAAPAGDTPFRVLDLGASPGSWSLYILRCFRALHKKVFVAACDLNMPAFGPELNGADKQLFDDKESFYFLKGDFTLEENRNALAGQGPFDLILSDAAPATSGIRSLDCARSIELAENVFYIAGSSLKKGGNFAVKVFQGAESGLLLKKLKTSYTGVKSFKPQACRPNSFETYFVGKCPTGAMPAP